MEMYLIKDSDEHDVVEVKLDRKEADDFAAEWDGYVVPINVNVTPEGVRDLLYRYLVVGD